MLKTPSPFPLISPENAKAILLGGKSITFSAKSITSIAKSNASASGSNASTLKHKGEMLKTTCTESTTIVKEHWILVSARIISQTFGELKITL